MKLKPIIVLVLLAAIHGIGYAQLPKDPSGLYEFKPAMKDGSTVEYELSLNENGTYYFGMIHLLPTGKDYQYNEVGHWELGAKKLISFVPSKEVDATGDPDLSVTPARLVKKRSSWDPEGKYPYLLKFQRSDSRLVSGLELFPVKGP